MYFIKWMAVALLLLFVESVTAQPTENYPNDGINTTLPNGKILEMDEAIQIALEKNLQIQAARNSVDGTSWGVRSAYAQFLPSVDLNFQYSRLDAGTVDRANIFVDVGRELVKQYAPNEDPNQIRPAAWRDSYGPSISVSQPIFTGGALLANLDVAQAKDMTAQANLANTEQEVIYNTQRAYFEMLKASELLAVAKDNLQTAEEHLNSARKQVEAGLRSRTEILRWEVQQANAESFLVRAENGLALARPALNQVLGLDMQTEYAVVPVEEVDVEIPATLEEQTALALRMHPGLRVAEANVDLAGAQVRVVRANFTPKVSLAYNYNWEANNTLKLDSYKTWSLGIIAQFPIFNSFRDYTTLQQVNATKRQARNLQTDFERGLRLQVMQASLNLEAAKKQLALTEKAKEHAEENFRVVKNSYEVGLTSNLDFLDAQNAQNQARWDHVNARYDYLLTKTALAQAMGVLSR